MPVVKYYVYENAVFVWSAGGYVHKLKGRCRVRRERVPRRELGRMRAYRLERSDDDDGPGVGDDPVATTEVRQLRQAVGGP